MNIESLRFTLEQASLASLGVGFLLGFVFTFNPVALAAIPVSIAYVTKSRDPRTATLYGGLFVLGMVITQTLLGLIAGFGGHWVAQLLGREWGLVLGPALILLGLMWPGWIRLPLPSISLRGKTGQQRLGGSGTGRILLRRGVPVLHARARGVARHRGRDRVASVRRNAAFCVCDGARSPRHSGCRDGGLAGEPVDA